MKINAAFLQKKADFLRKCLNIGEYCVICARRSSSGIDLCHHCESLIVRLAKVERQIVVSHLCVACGNEMPLPKKRSNDAKNCSVLPGATAVANTRCADCASTPGLLTNILAPYRYEFPLDNMIWQLKYGEQRQLARVSGSLMSRHIQSTRNGIKMPQMLIPVPLHRRRQLKRGFNQARDIAYWCARDLGVPINSGCVRRVVDTDSLAGLSRAERQHRILGAFEASSAVADKHVAIVDDVLTTGSTARELARELYDTGALSVELWVLARTSSTRPTG